MNKATKVLFSCFLLAFLLASTSWAQVTKISEARTMDGSEVTIEGVMNTPDYGFNNGQFYVQDSTGGINVFYSGVGGSNNQDSPDYTGWTLGDTLQITGTIGAFGEQIQIAPTSVTVVGAGDTRPAPSMISTEGLKVDSDLQGTIVKIENVSLPDTVTWPADAQSGSGVSVDVAAGDSTFQIFIDRGESYFDGAPAPTERFNLTGVLGRFGENVQILPFDTTDVQNIVEVTFSVNTATMPDTLMEDHYVGIFGGVSGPNGASSNYIGQTVDWNNSTDLVAENLGGDYWSVTFDMAAGDEINFKYWAGVDSETALVNGSEQGWESGGNRVFSLPVDQAADTVAPLNWYETREAPFASEEDSVSLYFRVNVGAFVQNTQFNPETDKVGIRGIPAIFQNPEDWSSTAVYLESEGENTENNLMYSGTVRVHKDSVSTFSDPVPYKFVLDKADGSTAWDNVDGNTDGNRFLDVSAEDSTIHWAYFQQTAPTEATIVSTELNFEVNVGILEGLGFFNSSIDTVFVRGTFNDWGTNNQMTFNSFSGKYEATSIPITAAVDSEVKYKYYVKWDQRRDEEESEFFLAGITSDGSGWEEPGVTGGSDRVFSIENSESQETRSEFYNGVEPEALLTENNVEGGAITVTFSYDMTPAESYTADPFDPATDSVYLFVDTPFFALTNDIVVPGDNGENFITQPAEDIERLRFTDDDGDGVYTLELDLKLPTLNHIGFRIAYGSALAADGELLANGGGFDAGRRHYQYIQPVFDSENNVTWPSTYTFPTLEWKREDLPWETPPDYGIPVSNEDEGLTSPKEFELSQNYPNPFNPTTNISFKLGSASNVTLSVYNVLGQKVASLLTNSRMSAGSYTVGFDASQLSSGIYFYRIEAGSFVKQRSMTLIK